MISYILNLIQSPVLDPALLEDPAPPAPIPVAYTTIKAAAEAAEEFQEACENPPEEEASSRPSSPQDSSMESEAASSSGRVKRKRIRKKKPAKAETDGGALPPNPPAPPASKRRVSVADFIPNYSKETKKAEPPQERAPAQEKKPFLFINHNYVSITFPEEKLTSLFNQALDLLGCDQEFIPSQNPHITIATELEIQGKGLSAAQRRQISQYCKQEVKDYSFSPLQLRRILRQPTPMDPIQELLIVEVEPSKDIQKLRKWLRDDAHVLQGDAGDTPKNSHFHITLAARTIPQGEFVNTAALKHRKIVTLSLISLQ